MGASGLLLRVQDVMKNRSKGELLVLQEGRLHLSMTAKRGLQQDERVQEDNQGPMGEEAARLTVRQVLLIT